MENGVFTAIGRLAASEDEVMRNLNSRLVQPPFVESHMHPEPCLSAGVKYGMNPEVLFEEGQLSGCGCVCILTGEPVPSIGCNRLFSVGDRSEKDVPAAKDNVLSGIVRINNEAAGNFIY